MKVWGTMVLLAAMSCSAAAREPTLKILTPPEHATVSSKSVYVVGRTSSPYVEIFLNGASVETTRATDSVFHAFVEFGFGINTVTAVTRETIDRAVYSVGIRDEIEVLYTPSRINRFARVYEPLNFHDSDVIRECIGCHNLDLSTDSPAAAQETCKNCHTEHARTFKSHSETDSTACVTCHVSNGQMVATRSRTENLCFNCHPEREGLFSLEYMHGPVAGGSCLCHDPHGSEYEKGLASPVEILCYSCHGEVESELEELVVHRPFELGDCVSCHDPHASNNRWALVKSSQEVCQKCHDPEHGFDHNHPYNVRPRAALNVPLKLTIRGQLECISCHSPHSSPAEHLLRITTEFTCAGCHTEKL